MHVRPRRVAVEIEIEPSVLPRIEPGFGGRQNQRRMRGRDQLHLGAVEQFLADVPQRLEHRPLPPGVQMALHFVEEHDDLADDLLAKAFRRDPVLAPGPGQDVGERGHPANPGRRVQDRHGAGIARPDGRYVSCVVERQPHGRARLDPVIAAPVRGQGAQGLRHGLRLGVPGLDPARPVMQQPVAERNLPPVHDDLETVPDLGLREHVRGTALRVDQVRKRWPVVTNGVPHRKRTVGVRIYDQSVGFLPPAGLPGFVRSRIIHPGFGRLVGVAHTKRYR